MVETNAYNKFSFISIFLRKNYKLIYGYAKYCKNMYIQFIMIKNHLSQVLHSNCVYCTFSIIDKNSKIDEEKKNYSNNVAEVWRNYFEKNFSFILI